jgi:hypothetical protein
MPCVPAMRRHAFSHVYCKRTGAPVTQSVDRPPEQMLQRLAGTVMSNPHLPAELLDHIVDHLHDAEDALRKCCLVSKSWIPRTRWHLFANIAFPAVGSLESWKKTFPDPSMSPAHYTKTLSVGCSEVVTAADADEGGWIRGFSCVAHLEMCSQGSVSSSLVPFHSLPAIKSLRITFPVLPFQQVFNLILSFPFLEDLEVVSSYDGPDRLPTAQPSRPPMLTGSLKLCLQGGMEHFIRRLLSLPGGIHFRKLALTWLREEDVPLTTGLVEECFRTLESLEIASNPLRASIQRPHPRR